MAKRKLSRFAILGAIHKAPASGYGLKRYFARAHISFWSESEAQIYTTLKELHAEGLLTSHKKEAESGGEKTIYTITEAGEQVLTTWLHGKLPKEGPTRDERMLRILFAESASPAHATMMLAVMQDELSAKLKALDAEAEAEGDVPFYEERLRALERDRLTLTLAWIKETLEAIGL